MKKTRFSILTITALIVVFISGQAHQVAALPETLNWQYAGWSGGGTYPAIVPDPNVAGRAFLLSDVAGLWRSENHGDQWAFKTTGITNMVMAFIAVAPSNSSIMYAGGDAGLYKSVDAGETWSFVTSQNPMSFLRPDNYRSIAVDRLNSNKVFAGTKTGEVFTTVNGGATWARVGTTTYPFGQSGPISAVYVTRDNTTLFVGSNLGLRKCDLNTGVWSFVNSGGNAVSDIFGYGFTETIYITYGNRVAWTTDKGATFQFSANIPIANSIAYRLSVASDPGGNIKILVGWRNGGAGGVVLSMNGGGSWTDIERNLSYDLGSNPTREWFQGFHWPSSVAIDSNNVNILYFSDAWGVWRSDDNGQSWKEKIKGAANTVGTDVNVMSDGSLLVSTMDNGLLKSIDGGKTYKSLIPSASIQGDHINGHVWRVLSRGNKIIATSSPWVLSRNQVFISTDGGVTFTVTSNGLPQTRPNTNTVWGQSYPRGLAIDPNNPSRVYLGMDGDNGGGLFISNDGGYNWARSSGQPGSLRIFNGLAVDPTATNRIYWGAFGSAGGVFRSEDYGLTWTRVFSAMTWVCDVAVGSDGKVYATGDSNGPVLYVSSDRGASWQLLKQFSGLGGAGEAITIDPYNPKRIAISSQKWQWAPTKIHMTEDGGSTWTDITADLPNGEGANAMAFGNNGNTLYMSRYAGTTYRLSLSSSSDAIAPTAPANLLAEQSGTQVNLNWSASTDNVGVTGYQVLRNNAQLTTVTTTSFTDTTAAANATYSYAIRAFDAASNFSSPSNTATLTIEIASDVDTTDPTVPAGLTATVNGLQVSLSWSASTDNVGVAIYEILNNGNVIGTNTSTAFLHNATAGATYNYTVRAKDIVGNVSGLSSIVTVTIPPQKIVGPTAPTNLTVSVISGPQALISWSAPATGSSYNVYRNGVWLKWVNTLSTFDNTVVAGSVYKYKVIAYDILGLPSLFSEEVSLTIPGSDAIAPSAPSNLNAFLSDTTVNLSWSASTDNVGVAGYQVFQDGVLKGKTSSTTYSITDLAKEQVYSFTVKAYDGANNVSSFSNTASVTVLIADTTAPSTPSNFKASVIASGPSVALSWSASTDNVGVARYKIYDDFTVEMATTTGTSFTLTPVTSNTDYNFTVKACDSAGNCSAATKQIKVDVPAFDNTTAPSAPSNLIAMMSGSSVYIAWSSSTNAIGYMLSRNGIFLKNVTTVSTTDSTVIAGQTYSYSVQAFDGANKYSAPSNSMVVKVPGFAPDTTAPSTPSNFKASVIASGPSVALSWSASTDNVGVARYKIYDDFTVEMATTTGTSFTLTPAITNTDYNFTVKACDAAGNCSAATNQIKVDVPSGLDTIAPSVPSNFKAYAASGPSVALSWSASTDNVGVARYKIYDDFTVEMATTTGTSFTLTPVTSNTDYNFTVKACDSAGNCSAATKQIKVDVP